MEKISTLYVKFLSYIETARLDKVAITRNVHIKDWEIYWTFIKLQESILWREFNLKKGFNFSMLIYLMYCRTNKPIF